MIVHTPLAVQQRANYCGICQNQNCVFSMFIEPCFCRGPLSVVHEQCLVQTINAKYFDHSAVPKNSEGFLTYNCPDCNAQIMFREGFKRELIKCSEYSGCEKLMVGILIISLLIIIFGFAAPSLTDFVGTAEYGLYVILAIALLGFLYMMYKRMTTQFWKTGPPNETQMNFSKPY